MLAFSCQETELLEVDMNESIVLDLSSGETRADDSPAESFVSHLDIFIFKADQSGSGYTQGEKAYYGRYSVNNASSITLDAKRSSFGENDRFYVYLIANSTFTEDEMAAKVSTFNDLQVLKQEDAYIHLTGLTADNSPKYFLMDAIATQGTAKTSPVQLFRRLERGLRFWTDGNFPVTGGHGNRCAYRTTGRSAASSAARTICSM